MEDYQIQEIEDKKKWLKRYKKNVACIDRLNEKLSLLESKITKIKSPNYSGMPRGGTPVDLADLLGDKEELEDRIDRLKIKGRAIRVEILAEIDKLEDAKCCEVLESFFIDCMTMGDIADSTGYSIRSVIRSYSKGIEILTQLDYDMTEE